MIKMQFILPLTKENFLLFAAKEYTNQYCLGVTEFNSDLKRFMYIKRLLNKHLNSTEFDFRLLVNHIIILNNLFSVKALNRMLYFYCDSKSWPTIKCITEFLKISDIAIPEVRGNIKKCKKTYKLLGEL